MKVLIIEDEPRAANQLQTLLKECSFEYELMDIIDSIEESVGWFGCNSKPDLIFMDIQLADGLSFEIFQKVDIKIPVIFTTAFDQYAIQAFKVNSVDYLLKPIQKEDLNFALDKFSSTKKPNLVEPSILQHLMESMQTRSLRQGVLVKEGNGFVQIKIMDILYLYSDGGITFGVTASKRYIIEETLDKFYGDLDHNQFYRINRGQVVSKMAIEKISPYFNHRIKLTISNPRDLEFIVSRQKSSEFKKWMNR